MTANVKKINHEFTISPHFAGQRIDQVLAKMLPDYSRMQIKSWLESGAIQVNGHSVLPKFKVKGNELITITATITANEHWQPEAIPLSIVYEDEMLLVINKPPGLVVHPAPGHRQHTLVNALLHYHPNLNLLPRAGILHRLDKDTSGLLLIAKTQRALIHLGKQLRQRAIVREYQAIVQGHLISGGTINAAIGRHPLQRKQMAVINTGKPAITHYRILEKYQHHTLISVRLETGRTHQIRVHFAHLRHPLLGDPVYNKRLHLGHNLSPLLISEIGNFKRQALHAFALGFTHPCTQQPFRLTADMPADMQHLIELLREQ